MQAGLGIGVLAREPQRGQRAAGLPQCGAPQSLLPVSPARSHGPTSSLGVPIEIRDDRIEALVDVFLAVVACHAVFGLG